MRYVTPLCMGIRVIIKNMECNVYSTIFNSTVMFAMNLERIITFTWHKSDNIVRASRRVCRDHGEWEVWIVTNRERLKSYRINNFLKVNPYNINSPISFRSTWFSPWAVPFLDQVVQILTNTTVDKLQRYETHSISHTILRHCHKIGLFADFVHRYHNLEWAHCIS